MANDSPVKIYNSLKKSNAGSLDKSSPCCICVGRASNQLDIRHFHLSTQYYYKQCYKNGDTNPYCYHCKRNHPADPMSRIRCLVTSSCLSGIPYLREWEGYSHHCDWECTSGGTYDTGRKNWERCYSTHPLPVDTIVAGGWNDVKQLVREHTDPRISPLDQQLESQEVISNIDQAFREKLEKFWKTVQEHKKEKETDDTLAFLKVFLVPAYFWTNEDGNPPSEDYLNYQPVIDAVNLTIGAFNVEIGSPHAPNVHTTGRRYGKKSKSSYIFTRFREKEKAKMLHLADPFRVSMTMSLMKYFEARTPKSVNCLE